MVFKWLPRHTFYLERGECVSILVEFFFYFAAVGTVPVPVLVHLWGWWLVVWIIDGTVYVRVMAYVATQENIIAAKIVEEKLVFGCNLQDFSTVINDV